jgi:hypothetical protein
MAAAVSAALLAPVTASASASTWTVMPAQQDATVDYLNAVSCPTTSFCLALGTQGPIPVAFEWNGSTWSNAPDSPGEPEESEVKALSCVSASFCVAVGSNFLGYSYGNQAAAWVWNGSTWSGMTASSPTKWDSLAAVKCVSASDCEAVGEQSAHYGYGYHLLAEGWNGKTWSAQPFKTPTGQVTGTPEAVACASATSCEAVGQKAQNGAFAGLALRWNGTSWSPQKLPAVTGTTNLTGVSCYRAGCTAVGSGGGGTLAEVWNGSRWALQSPVGSGNLKGAAGGTAWQAVHCGSATSCTVAGSWRDAASNTYTLAETWNGHTWAQATTPSPTVGSTTDDWFSALSCTPGTRVCTAVGFGYSPTDLMFAVRN